MPTALLIFFCPTASRTPEVNSLSSLEFIGVFSFPFAPLGFLPIYFCIFEGEPSGDALAALTRERLKHQPNRHRLRIEFAL